MTRRELVEQMLRDAGPTGVTTSQFLRAGAGSRFGARVQELRNQGLTIPCTRVRDGEFRYVLDVEGGGDGLVQPEVRGIETPDDVGAPAAPLSAEPVALFDTYDYTPRARYGREEEAA